MTPDAIEYESSFVCSRGSSSDKYIYALNPGNPEVVNLMIAGHETTAATLGFTLQQLGTHGDLLKDRVGIQSPVRKCVVLPLAIFFVKSFL